jgi:molecular chaperone GrpE
MTPQESEQREQERAADEPVDGVHETVVDPVADEASEVEHDLDELLARAGKADEYLALAQRTQADFENFRKRMARDVAAAEARGVGRLARELLPALDNLGRALAAAEAEGEASGHLAEGVRLVHDDLLAALGRAGIEPFSPQGERFDPNEHEAMAQQPVQGAEPGTVVEVYQQGFRQDGAVLRPARVVVAA